MADYLTMWEAKGNLEGLKVAFVGDGNNVAHSLMFAGAQLGAHVWVATPAGYEPKLDAESNGATAMRCKETGGSCTVTNDPVGSGFGCRRRLHRCLGEHGPGGGSGEAEAKFRHSGQR